MGAQNRPQEVPEKIKNDIEKRRKKNSDKKSIKSAKKNAFGPARETSPPNLSPDGASHLYPGAVGSGRRKGRGACGGIKGGLHNNIKQYVTI